MTITISKSLIKKLPPEEQDGLEEYLWVKSAGKCWLCEEPLNRAADSIEADHEVPEAEGGPNTRDNLNLAHIGCNRAKRASASVDVRPYLRLTAFIRKNGGALRYGECLEHFAISPAPSIVEMSGDSVRFELPDGTISEHAVFREPDDGGRFPHVFVELPRAALYNDDECQPRTIKLPQIWAIYSDIRDNPLHEPPSCRLVSDGTPNRFRLAMFDGQHKTIASWMRAREGIVTKVYLDLDREEANRLVNSIQAKIKKLPLSPFELAAKMGEEWSDKLARYEEAVGSENASEAGFLQWLPKEDSRRGKQAFRAALVQNLLGSGNLRFLKFVKRAGAGGATAPVTENTFKTKVLERLVHLDALTEKASEIEQLRARERDNIVRTLNLLTDLAFEVPEGAAELNEAEQTRVERMTYQSALAYISKLVRELVARVLAVDANRAFMEREPTDAEWEEIEEGMRLLVHHPVWQAKLESTELLQALQDALRKNQDVQKLFPKLGLKLAYLVKVEGLAADWYDG